MVGQSSLDVAPVPNIQCTSCLRRSHYKLVLFPCQGAGCKRNWGYSSTLESCAQDDIGYAYLVHKHGLGIQSRPRYQYSENRRAKVWLTCQPAHVFNQINKNPPGRLPRSKIKIAPDEFALRIPLPKVIDAAVSYLIWLLFKLDAEKRILKSIFLLACPFPDHDLQRCVLPSQAPSVCLYLNLHAYSLLVVPQSTCFIAAEAIVPPESGGDGRRAMSPKSRPLPLVAIPSGKQECPNHQLAKCQDARHRRALR